MPAACFLPSVLIIPPSLLFFTPLRLCQMLLCCVGVLTKHLGQILSLTHTRRSTCTLAQLLFMRKLIFMEKDAGRSESRKKPFEKLMSPDGSQQVAKDWDLSHLAKLVCVSVCVSHLPGVCVAVPSLEGCFHSFTTSSLCFCLLLTRGDEGRTGVCGRVCVGGGDGLLACQKPSSSEQYPTFYNLLLRCDRKTDDERAYSSPSTFLSHTCETFDTSLTTSDI